MTRAKRSSSEALFKRSARDANKDCVMLDGTKNLPELISSLLADGHSVQFSAPGGSMYPTIRHGDVITVMPIKAASVDISDIILYRHSSGVTAHRVIRIITKCHDHSRRTILKPHSSALSSQSCFILRGDAAILFDEPVTADQILGKVTHIKRKGRKNNPYAIKTTICYKARRLAVRFKGFIFSSTISQILSCLFLLYSAQDSID